MWIPTRVALNAAMKLLGDDTVPAGQKINGAFLVLFKAPPPAIIDVAWGDVSATEADFSGYARAALGTWSAPVVGEGGKSLRINTAEIFTADDTITTNTVYGQGLLGSDSATLLATEAFDTPIPIAALGASVISTPIFGMGPNAAGYGSSLVTT